MLHWLKIERRRLRFEELLQAREDQSEQPLSEMGVVDEDKENLTELGEETRQLLNAAAIVVALSVLYFLWAPILPVFDAMSAVTLWTSTVMVEGVATVNRITLDIVVFVTLMIGVTIYAARKLPALVELVLRSRTDVSAGTRYTVSTLLNYIILGVGILVALSKLGLDWSKLQWLVAALGVGIGFGLQEIVANFISGIIILFERPVRVGDFVTIGDTDGFVTKIRIRATTIRSRDAHELLVPNKEFITGRLLNWSLTDQTSRLQIIIGIAYGSDVDKAMRLMDEAARQNKNVLDQPSPNVIFQSFGDNALNIILRCFVSSVEYRESTISELNRAINRKFNEAGIVIAFPQRDLHIDASAPLPVRIEGGQQDQVKEDKTP